jgi:pimeloyl-ACP methyl ester carboxylesterase
VEHVDVEGLRIGYERVGSGPPLVLLHGALSDSRDWRPQLDALSDEFTVVAWDAPGCGRSSDPPEHFSLADYADCLADFVEVVDLERPHVLGLSWGGGLAIQLAGRRPRIPRTLVLSGAYAGWAGSLPAEVVDARLQQCLREAELPPEQWVRDSIPGLLTDAAPPETVDEVVAIMCDARPAGYVTMARGFAEADLRDVLPTIAVPTLLLYGEVDQRAPLPVAEAIHEQIPGSTLVVLPGVGHLCNVEASDRFNAEVRAFLRSS